MRKQVVNITILLPFSPEFTRSSSSSSSSSISLLFLFRELFCSHRKNDDGRAGGKVVEISLKSPSGCENHERTSKSSYFVTFSSSRVMTGGFKMKMKSFSSFLRSLLVVAARTMHDSTTLYNETSLFITFGEKVWGNALHMRRYKFERRRLMMA